MIRHPPNSKIVIETTPLFGGLGALDVSVHVTSTGLNGCPMSVGRFTRSGAGPGSGATNPTRPADVLMLVIPLQPIPKHETVRDGHSIVNLGYGVGALVCTDRRFAWQQHVYFSFDTINFVIPLSALDLAHKGMELGQGDKLHCFLGVFDAVTYGLAQSLAPMLRMPGEVNPLFIDYIFAALIAHISFTYTRARPFVSHGGLSASQERRVVGRLLEALDDVPTTKELAEICDLSPGHFIRAFKQTMGSPPHRWLLQQRVERSKELLSSGHLPISEIALRCGFSDQSHFTRVFSRAVGVAPGRWQRDRLN